MVFLFIVEGNLGRCAFILAKGMFFLYDSACSNNAKKWRCLVVNAKTVKSPPNSFSGGVSKHSDKKT